MGEKKGEKKAYELKRILDRDCSTIDALRYTRIINSKRFSFHQPFQFYLAGLYETIKVTVSNSKKEAMPAKDGRACLEKSLKATILRNQSPGSLYEIG